MQIKEVYRTIMAILLLGNVSFIAERSSTSIRNPSHLKSVCQLIGCSNPKRIQQLLCDEVPPEGAALRRDFLAQTWYKIVLDYIIYHINNYFRSRFGTPAPRTKTSKINILHIPAYDLRNSTPVCKPLQIITFDSYNK
mgnify:CR=1 FL=1